MSFFLVVAIFNLLCVCSVGGGGVEGDKVMIGISYI